MPRTAWSYTVAPTSRVNIWANGDVPELGDGTFSADVRVVNYQPIAVEKALYWNADGVTWPPARMSRRRACRHRSGRTAQRAADPEAVADLRQRAARRNSGGCRPHRA